MDNIRAEAWQQGRADTIEECIELVKKIKLRAYLCLANGCDEKQDFAYENVGNYIDGIVEDLVQMKEHNNG